MWALLACRTFAPPPTLMLLKLALRNLAHDRTRMLTAVVGIAFASFLMAIEGSLLYGFTLAASRVVDAIDADVWITAKGIPSLDFASPLPRRYREIAMGAPGLAKTGEIAATWTYYTRPDGNRTMVMLVGVEADFLGRIPGPRSSAAAVGKATGGLIVDRTDVTVLGIDSTAAEVEIASRRAQIVKIADGFSSFLGTPLVFTDYQDARNYLRLLPEQTSIVLGRVSPGFEIASSIAWLRDRLPDADVWSREEFSWRSRSYWLIQTGAGGALSLAALLGFLIGLVVVTQIMFALTVESLEEFATLKAIGAPPHFIRDVVRTQSLICGIIGAIVGLLAAGPFTVIARNVVTWVVMPWWMFPVVAGSVVMMCLGAAHIAARPALRVDPERVFRA